MNSLLCHFSKCRWMNQIIKDFCYCALVMLFFSFFYFSQFFHYCFCIHFASHLFTFLFLPKTFFYTDTLFWTFLPYRMIKSLIGYANMRIINRWFDMLWKESFPTPDILIRHINNKISKTSHLGMKIKGDDSHQSIKIMKYPWVEIVKDFIL